MHMLMDRPFVLYRHAWKCFDLPSNCRLDFSILTVIPPVFFRTTILVHPQTSRPNASAQ